jgi:hypothetical protein
LKQQRNTNFICPLCLNFIKRDQKRIKIPRRKGQYTRTHYKCIKPVISQYLDELEDARVKDR